MIRTENSSPIAIERLDIVDSTSAQARRLVESGGFGDRPRLFVALEQTEGVGRFGRAWASPIGGLWMTLGWPVTALAAEVLDGLGLRIGLALLHAIDHTLAGHGHDSDVRIKWPNDILIHGRKVAGALCETIRMDATTYILVGVGINGNFDVDALPVELHTTATTLLDEIGAPIGDAQYLARDRIDLHFIEAIGAHLEDPLAGAEVHPVDVLKALELRVILGKDNLEQLLVGDEAFQVVSFAGTDPAADGGRLDPIHLFLDQQEKPRHGRNCQNHAECEAGPFVRVPE